MVFNEFCHLILCFGVAPTRQYKKEKKTKQKKTILQIFQNFFRSFKTLVLYAKPFRNLYVNYLNIKTIFKFEPN